MFSFDRDERRDVYVASGLDLHCLILPTMAISLFINWLKNNYFVNKMNVIVLQHAGTKAFLDCTGRFPQNRVVHLSLYFSFYEMYMACDNKMTTIVRLSPQNKARRVWQSLIGSWLEGGAVWPRPGAMGFTKGKHVDEPLFWWQE